MPISITLEQAQLGGRRSAEARARRKNLKAETRALERFERASDAMAAVLINAALGRAGFEDLSSKDRAGFAVKVLEYGVGRPRQTTEPQTPLVEPVQQGLHFDIAPATGATHFGVIGSSGDVSGGVDPASSLADPDRDLQPDDLLSEQGLDYEQTLNARFEKTVDGRS